ncbi:MAG: 50S ribosomal protein L19, partial [Nitrospirae bacterium]|nr:50S ribosomal protein L19 [Nitrospirota bacterium]
MNLIQPIEEGYKKAMPAFNVGDTVRIYVKVVEGDKERLQPYEGVVISRKGSGIRETF